MKLTLKLKITLLATAMIVVLLGVVGFAQDQRLGRDFRTVLLLQQDALAQAMADNLSDKLAYHLNVLEHSASLIDQSILTDPAARQAFLNHRSAARGLFDGVAIVSLDGNVLANEPPLPAGTRLNIADRAYFQHVVTTGRTTVSAPVLGRTTGTAVVVFSVPVRDAAGRMIAVASAGLNLQRSNMLGQLAMTPVGRTGHFEVVTLGPQPVYMVHPDPARLLQPAALPAAHATDLVTRKAIAGADWELRVVLPAWEADAPVREGQRQLVTDLALLGAAAAVLTWLLMYRLLRPLSSLHDAIQLLRRRPGVDVQLPTHLQDEQGALAREFDGLMRELRSQQQELSVVSQASPVGMFRTDAQGHIVYANAAYLRIHGLAAHEISRGWLALVPEAQREAAWAGWQDVVRTQREFRVVRRVQSREGRVQVLSVHSAAIDQGEARSPSGAAGWGHVGTVTDITELVAAQKALQMLTAIFDATTDLVVQTDARGQVSYMNPAVRKLLGFTPDESVTGHHFTEFNTPQTNERYRTEILPAVKAHNVWVGETTVLGSHGRVLPVSHMVIAHRGRDGHIEHFSAIMRDITQQRADSDEARRQTATLQSISDAIPSVVAVVGADGHYRYVNRAFERWIGRPRAQIVGHSVQDVLGPDEYRRSLPALERVRQGETVRFEKAYSGEAGTHHLAISYIPLFTADGQVDGFVGVAHDITSHRVEAGRLLAMAQTDPLTGLLNRTGFEWFIEREIIAGGGPNLALLYFDLDHFKQINDRHGHPAGDALLRQFGQRLRTLVRPSDAVVRLGGDEFAIVLTDMREMDHVLSVAAKVVQSAAEAFEFNGAPLRVGASVGVALGVHAGTGVSDLVARADRALYRAKQAGRGRVMAEPALSSDESCEVVG